MPNITINTLKDFFQFIKSDTFDVYDKKWDYGTAIVYEPQNERNDNYDKFVNYLVENTDFVAKIDDITITADFIKFINERKDVFFNFMEKNNRDDFKPSNADIDLPEAYTKEDFIEDISVQTLISLLNGNYSEKDYEELMSAFEKSDKEKILTNVDKTLGTLNYGLSKDLGKKLHLDEAYNYMPNKKGKGL